MIVLDDEYPAGQVDLRRFAMGATRILHRLQRK
jgi:hypothetical protein